MHHFYLYSVRDLCDIHRNQNLQTLEKTKMSEPVIVIGTIPVEDYSKGYSEEITVSDFFLSVTDLIEYLQSLNIDSPQDLDLLLEKHKNVRYNKNVDKMSPIK